MGQIKSSPNIAKLTSHLVDRINDGQVANNSVRVEFPKSGNIREGGRNNFLAQIAGSLRARNLGYSTIASVLVQINELECHPALPSKEVRKIARSINRYESKQEEAFGNLADVVPEDVEFLIEPQIPLGSTTILDGMMGQGKSTLLSDIISRVTTGKPPPFANTIKKGRVLILSAEDDPARALKPRLIAAGADMELIRYQKVPFSLNEEGIQMLRNEIAQYRPILCVIDPIIAYMEGGADSSNSVDMTRFMSELDLIAREFACAIVLVRHLRKAKADSTLLQGLGSVAIIARVRSALLLGRDPSDPEIRIIAHHKSSYAVEAPPFGFRLVSAPNSKYPVVNYVDCDPTLTPEDITRPPEKSAGRPSDEKDHAMQFLRDFLSEGEQKARVIETAAQARGISISTLRRAREDLRVIVTKGRNSKWSLPK